MSTEDFIKSKGLLNDGFKKFVISGAFGTVLLNELLSEYASMAIERCKEKATYYDAEPKCVIDFIENVKSEFV